jgi:hypothetical protein
MSFLKPDPPTPPNPIETSRASTSTNVSTAVANAFLNNVNQVTPQGALNYDATGNFGWTDPTTGQTYNIPTFTATQTLSPQQKAIQDQSTQTQYNLSNMAANQSASLRDMLSSGVNTSGAPSGGQANWLWDNGYGMANGDIANVGSQQRALGPAGDITTSYGPGDFSADRSKVEESLYQRMDPQLQRDRGAMEARLADQGIKVGSPGYQAAMDQFNRQLTDTRLGITQTAGAEQQRMMEMAAQRAGFQNAAQQQQFTQNLQGGTFANQAQQQEFQQAGLRTQAANAASAQNLARQQSAFQAANAQRNQYMGELYQQRNQPINEITALLSGGQVQNPSFVNTPSNQIATTDIAGLINNKFSQDMSTYQQQSANFNSLMGGIFGAIGGLARSDRRVKEDISKVGTVFAASSDGGKPEELPVYKYAFKDDPASTEHVGPMAQDVERIEPKAVKTIGGVKHIDRTRLASILKVA